MATPNKDFLQVLKQNEFKEFSKNLRVRCLVSGLFCIVCCEWIWEYFRRLIPAQLEM